jgi:hypothetical protein
MPHTFACADAVFAKTMVAEFQMLSQPIGKTTKRKGIAEGAKLGMESDLHFTWCAISTTSRTRSIKDSVLAGVRVGATFFPVRVSFIVCPQRVNAHMDNAQPEVDGRVAMADLESKFRP